MCIYAFVCFCSYAITLHQMKAVKFALPPAWGTRLARVYNIQNFYLIQSCLGIHSGTQTVPSLPANHPPTHPQNPLILSTHGPSRSLVSPRESTAQAKIRVGMEDWRDSWMLLRIFSCLIKYCTVGVFSSPLRQTWKRIYTYFGLSVALCSMWAWNWKGT